MRADVTAPGQVEHPDGAEPVQVNEGLPVTRVEVRNAGDRAVQVGSHDHFYEVNPALEIRPVPVAVDAEPDRECAYGKRLNIPAGKSRRFETGCRVEVDLVPLRGDRVVMGLRGMVGGVLHD
ncbi:urease subunit beta [Actinomadura verrucosospora]|uniref:urease subunit beta n=1 Tax=Actinomadura verrucosospora TaxID=46165 RepID=UPI0015646189|nr:urease subunit beta [Actinomadura verrucosospora]